MYPSLNLLWGARLASASAVMANLANFFRRDLTRDVSTGTFGGALGVHAAEDAVQAEAILSEDGRMQVGRAEFVTLVQNKTRKFIQHWRPEYKYAADHLELIID